MKNAYLTLSLYDGDVILTVPEALARLDEIREALRVATVGPMSGADMDRVARLEDDADTIQREIVELVRRMARHV